jgi:hypothetical protein
MKIRKWLLIIPEDPAFSTGGWKIFKYKRGLNKAFKAALVSTIFWSNTKLFVFENFPTLGTLRAGLQ